MHKTLPILLKVLGAQVKYQNPPALGTLSLVCHLICCLPVSIVGASNMSVLLPTMIAGLVYYSKNVNTKPEEGSLAIKLNDILALLLAALVKILSTTPKDITKFVGIIIPSLLLLSSPGGSSLSYVPIQLLALQCLEILTSHPQARNAVLREKDQVAAVLSAVVDHPSMIIRNAVVQVRNVWYTLDK